MTVFEGKNFKLLEEMFPKIAAELKRQWGTAAFKPYLDGLEQDNGIEHRVGFPADVMMALMAVGDEHDTAFPHLIPQEKWLS